ncbi:MAG: nickel-responsive transcriptional regulator NikR [Candidatus Riflebacteria bacterium]|nr:nickel-responsive transcriptional regulator NikR [Candidatus Riflebacteria bacterium]
MGNTDEPLLRRFSVSMPADLVGQLDALVGRKGLANRSHALAEMVRAYLVDREAARGTQEIAGTITLVYDHHKRDLQAGLTEIQHDHQELIIATMHVHLDHHRCLEILTVRGKSRPVRDLADRLMATRGVTHGRLTVIATTSPKRSPRANHPRGAHS